MATGQVCVHVTTCVDAEVVDSSLEIWDVGLHLEELDPLQVCQCLDRQSHGHPEYSLDLLRYGEDVWT